MLVLDAGGVSRLAERSRQAAAMITVFRRRGLWPPLVPSAVLVDCLTDDSGRDANANRFLKTCDIKEGLSERVTRRAAGLRARAARRGSAVDAIVVTLAEPRGTVLTSDVGDVRALADHARGVTVERC